MFDLLGMLMGKLLYFVYNGVAGILPSEPKSVSFLGIAIIVTTIIFKLALTPLNKNQMKHQKKMAELQPEIQKIQKKYKNDPQTLAQKQQQLYKEAGYNPMSGCLPMLIQFPIIIAFFRVFREPAKYAFTEPGMYQAMAKNFFYIQNLDVPDPTMILGILAGAFTFMSTWMTQKRQKELTGGGDPQSEQAQSVMSTMMYIMPVMIFWFSRSMAAGLVLYWVTSNILQIIQQWLDQRKLEEVEEQVS